MFVALFVLAVAGTLFAKSRTVQVESLGSAPSRADFRINEVDLEEEAKGVRWRLKAEQVDAFQQEGRTLLRKLAIDVIQPDRAWTIVGDEGEHFEKTKRVEVRRNVVVTSTDGVRLETSVLRWDGEQKRLWTDAPVKVSRDGSWIEGTGLEVRMDDQVTTVRGRLHASFLPMRAP